MPKSTLDAAAARPAFVGGMAGRITRRVLVYTTLTALVMGGLGLYGTYRMIWNRVVESQPLALRLSSEWVRERLEQAPAELERLAQGASLQAWAEDVPKITEGSAPDPSVLLGVLSEAVKRSGTFGGLLILDIQGDVLAAAGSGPGLTGLRDLLRRKSALDSELLDTMQGIQLRAELGGLQEPAVRPIGFDSGPALHLVSVPIRDPLGRAVATLHGLVRRSELAARLRAESLGSGGNLFIVDSKRRILASARPVGTDENKSLSADLLNDKQRARPRVVWDSDLGEVAISSSPLGVHDWTVVATTPLVAAFQPLVLAGIIALGTGLALVALFTWMGSRLGTGIARPLWGLLHALRNAARGNIAELSAGANASGEGEGEALITAFNAMAEHQRTRRREHETSHRALQAQHSAFQHQYDTMSRRSITDPLTQLHNRRHFDSQLEREIKRKSRTGQSLALLILDIDDFKKLNDTFGHAAGDEFLKQVARILKEIVRETDLLARFGGEEFVVVATQTTIEGAVVLGQKICMAIAEASFIVDDTMRPRGATVSIGVAVFKGSQTDLFNAADAALYRAKSAGKNCVVAADDPED